MMEQEQINLQKDNEDYQKSFLAKMKANAVIQSHTSISILKYTNTEERQYWRTPMRYAKIRSQLEIQIWDDVNKMILLMRETPSQKPKQTSD